MGFEILNIHDVPSDEFQALLDAESRAWLQNLHWNFEASAQVVMGLLEGRRLSGFAARGDGRLTGYCFHFFDGTKAMIGDLFTCSPDGSAEAIHLLDKSLEVIMNTPGIRRIEAQLPHFSYHALNLWFRSRFFEGYMRQFMSLPFSDPTTALSLNDQLGMNNSVAAQPPHFRLETWKRKYDRSAARLLFRTYRNHIDAAINDQYASLDGATRLVENIVTLRGCGDFLEPASFVLIHRSTSEVVGLVGATAVRPGTAHIAQIAVATEFQKSGLGRLMMEASMQRIREQGFNEVSLTVTSLNAGAVRLYERLGFRVLSDFGAFTWQRH